MQIAIFDPVDDLCMWSESLTYGLFSSWGQEQPIVNFICSSYVGATVLENLKLKFN